MKLQYHPPQNDFFLEFDTRYPISLAHPLDFNQNPIRFFTELDSKATPIESAEFIGDVNQGGSCNVSEVTFIPHCHGTHTESIKHISSHLEHNLEHKEPSEILNGKTFFLCILINLPEIPEDNIITKKIIENKIDILKSRLSKKYNLDNISHFVEAMIINTRCTSFSIYPYLAVEAIEYLNELSIKHLLIDTPSVDPMKDNGKMLAHHAFWKQDSDKTITELIKVPSELKSDIYMLNLALPRFCLDAATSQPFLYKIEIQKND